MSYRLEESGMAVLELLFMFTCLLCASGVFADESEIVLVRGVTDDIIKRSQEDAFPAQLDVSFHTKSGDVTLQLKRKLNINHNAPVTFRSGRAVPKDSDIENVALYQDVNKRSAMSVTLKRDTDQRLRTLEGNFISDGVHYVIEPANKHVESLIEKIETRSLGLVKAVPHVLRRHPIQLRGMTVDDHPAMRRSRLVRENKFQQTRSRLLKLMTGSRDKRSANSQTARVSRFTVEIMLVLDHTIWERHMALAKNKEANAVKSLKYYFSHALNGMAMAYSTIDPIKYGMHIEIALLEFYIAETKAESDWTVKNIIKPVGNRKKYRNIGIKMNGVMDSLKKFHASRGRSWDKPDHILLFTRYNIDLSSTIGLSPMGGICSPDSFSVNEDIGIHSYLTAAHELAHNLGADHDGRGNGKACKASRKNIMTPFAGEIESKELKDVFIFSHCSIQAMKRTISGTDRNGWPRVCLFDRICKYANVPSDQLPGLKYTADQQCELRYGLHSFLCDDYGEEICLAMPCSSHSGKCVDQYPGAADGTQCAPGKMCHRGACVAKKTLKQDSKLLQSCSPVSLKKTSPAGCENTPKYTLIVEERNGRERTLNCGQLVEQYPDYCFNDREVAYECCHSCHSRGLYRGNKAPRETVKVNCDSRFES